MEGGSEIFPYMQLIINIDVAKLAVDTLPYELNIGFDMFCTFASED